MFEMVKKSMLAGVGLALKAWDEVEAMAKEVAEQSKMTEMEGRKFIDELQTRYEEAQKSLEARVEKSVKEILKKADVVTQDELKGLKKEIRDLKKLISDQGGGE
jgi:polyhydroxyalkanoate synthesis regulator phasin